jgi:hypothetical protein
MKSTMQSAGPIWRGDMLATMAREGQGSDNGQMGAVGAALAERPILGGTRRREFRP